MTLFILRPINNKSSNYQMRILYKGKRQIKIFNHKSQHSI